MNKHDEIRDENWRGKKLTKFEMNLKKERKKKNTLLEN